ncbi:MAG: hypothetical protein MRERV_13c009 [Mycoplasmataceae bacterium RV_VA103A]|nr:MAG: hypothetical protein MRERV_13c009 [Mycoplasmataceae bacterium RV_VA103A]
MTWTLYKQYLEQKILQEEEDTYLLNPEAKKKYSPSKEQELITALTNLIQSIDNSPYRSSSNSYSSLSEQDEEYHSLPDLDNLYTDSEQLITWQQLFPKREEVHFGKKQEIETEISPPTWTTLSKIFSDWTQQTTRAKKLQNFLTQEELLKLISEALINLNYDLIKQKGYDSIVRNWLKEYELLEKEEKKQLIKEYGLMSNLLTSWEEVSKMKESSSWYQKVSWKQVLWYGGGGLLIVIVVGWLWRKFND